MAPQNSIVISSVEEKTKNSQLALPVHAREVTGTSESGVGVCGVSVWSRSQEMIFRVRSAAITNKSAVRGGGGFENFHVEKVFE